MSTARPRAVVIEISSSCSLPHVRPQRVGDVRCDSDLVVTVCDRAHEEPGLGADLHWSVPDPVRAGTPEAFDRAFEELSRRVETFAPLLAPASTN
ncbi:hypothetical protein B0G38_000838 [Arthrobacter sp. VKM Ac-2550]|nr:hypothetical protein [Arthrobacter sp. VKM Ac-2550]